ncbi:hypothetical protein SAMN05444921_13335 [Streptomyces wuyuanensis]|uniref:Uncharacterized protein n=1 Tax=Streptomyces wuyuanensis TaxID=1196353 RepID=A0A1H0DD02_9ACTN|nr:hypothetical protein SAMN05444921_13335 [Streptomyces wuyuanensis]
MDASPNTPPQSPYTEPPRRRPVTIVLAAVLMVPVFATWLTAGIAWMVVTYRMEGDGLGKGLFWILAVLILLLCLFLGYMSATGAMGAWRGKDARLIIPARFTAFLFVIALINLVVNGRISYSPTQIVPLVVGALAILADSMVRSKSALAWLAQGARR